ncbi:MAG: DNA primase [Thermoproteota archaeon]|nr:DNA primase [Thermoproteota archaeon]
MGSGDLAKYPFLNEAGEYLRESSFGWEELDRPDMNYVIDRAADRIEIEVDGKIYDNLERYEIEILTFLISLLIVKSIGIEQVLKKFALAEARRAERFLTVDLRKQSETQRHSLFSKIFEDLFKLKIVISEDRRLFKVRVVDYLARASHFHEQEWKLINRLVHNGYVYLDADETVRLIRNELSVLIYDKVKAMTLPTLPQGIKSKADQLRVKLSSRYERRASAAVTEYPPCIKHALEVMKRGDNLPHSARVMLATYMLAIGKPVDEIVFMFEKAPDFNEKITRYQVEHLAGMKGGHTKYSVPSCDKLRNENLCFATAECDTLINPIQFGRKKK